MKETNNQKQALPGLCSFEQVLSWGPVWKYVPWSMRLTTKAS
jgi:hypothetical protein